jgi:hypothetical protein
VLDKEVQAAKDLLHSGNKRGALLALKKKKYQEQLLLKTDQQLMQLEQLTQAIEFALVEQQVLKGLETGNQVLKSIHQELSLDNVEKLMMDTHDAIEYQREIDEALSGSLSLEDQEAIEAELEALVSLEVFFLVYVQLHYRFSHTKLPRHTAKGNGAESAKSACGRHRRSNLQGKTTGVSPNSSHRTSRHPKNHSKRKASDKKDCECTFRSLNLLTLSFALYVHRFLQYKKFVVPFLR